MAAADIQEIRASSYVGFDSITRQIEHKLLKRGFQFNVIVVGAYSTYCSAHHVGDRALEIGSWKWMNAWQAWWIMRDSYTIAPSIAF